MAHSGAHRQPANLHPHLQAFTSHHHHHHLPHHQHQDQKACAASRNSSTPIAPTTIMAASNIYNHQQRSNGGAAIGVGVGVGPVGSGCVKPHYKGHQRRQSVARLLPDISKLRLLSWLVEASNELINCDIAIMDGVYAKLNRSRESLLFWQQSQAASSAASASRPPPPPPNVQPVANKLVISQQQQQQQQHHLNRHQHKQQKNSSLSGVSSNKHQQLLNNNINNNQHGNGGKSKLGRNKSNSLAGSVSGASGSGGRLGHNHHSLPLNNYGASTCLAALSLQPNKATAPSMAARADPDTESIVVGSTASETIMMMQQNLQRKADVAAASASGFASAGGQPTALGSAGSSLGPICDNSASPSAPTAPAVPISEPHYCDSSNNQSEEEEDVDEDDADNDADDCDDEDDDDDDDDGNSSAASSTTSSGIHGASVSSSASSSSSSSSSSASVSSSCASSTSAGSSNLFAGPAGAPVHGPASGFGQRETSQLSSAEQLSERIRRAVMEHNYLQNLLVNVIRQHDRQRDLLVQQRQAGQQLANNQWSSTSSMAAGGSAPGHGAGLLSSRIDLADIADALDDGCQCSCHQKRRLREQHQQNSHDSLGANSTLSSLSSLSSSFNKSNKASTLPSSSSLSLFQPQNLVSAGATARKNRRKKNTELSREDMLRKLSNKLCENCFETHYWLCACSSIELTPAAGSPFKGSHAAGQLNSAVTNITSGGSGGNKNDQSSQGANNTGNSHNMSSSLSASDSQQQQKQHQRASDNLDAIISLRNATFIKLVQQQVRSTISNSIELIDLIRKEIKSPESIKQKQLMRCFSASIQLLSSVANYVVPSQDISTFIPAEIMAGHQQRLHHHQYQQRNTQPATTLFNLPPADFDNLFMHPLLTASGASYASAYGAAAPAGSDQSSYHLAPAPEIPIRRRHNLHQYRQRRSSDEPARNNSRPSDDQDSFSPLPLDAAVSSSKPLKGQQQHSPGGGEKQKQSDRMAAKLSSKSKTSKSNENQHAGSTLEVANTNPNAVDSSSGASSNNSSASSSIARGQVQQSSLTKAHTSGAILDGKTSHDLSFDSIANISHDRHQQLTDEDVISRLQSGRAKFWQSSKFNFIKKLLQVKQQRLLRQQSKDRRIYNNKVQNKFRLVMMDLTHFNKSQQLLATENGVNSLLTSMRNVLEFGLYLTVKLY